MIVSPSLLSVFFLRLCRAACGILVPVTVFFLRFWKNKTAPVWCLGFRCKTASPRGPGAPLWTAHYHAICNGCPGSLPLLGSACCVCGCVPAFLNAHVDEAARNTASCCRGTRAAPPCGRARREGSGPGSHLLLCHDPAGPRPPGSGQG